MSRVQSRLNLDLPDLPSAPLPNESRVYLELRDLVLDLKVPPNDQLVVLPLAEHFRTSSTCMREALLRLAVEQLIDHRLNAGFFTRALQPDDMHDEYVFAFTLLRHAILAEPNDALHASLASFLVPQLDADDTLNLEYFLEAALQVIAALSGNHCIQHAIHAFCIKSRPLRRIDLLNPDRRETVLRRTHVLVKKLHDGDKFGAIQDLTAQLNEKLDRIPVLAAEANIKALAAPPLADQILQ